MKSTLTGIKDLDLKIVGDLSDRDLLNYCIVDSYARNIICNNDNLWRSRFVKKFGETYTRFKNDENSWKNFYLGIISIIGLDDLAEIHNFDEKEYLNFYIRIFTEALGMWDIFDFFYAYFSTYFGDTYAPFYLKRDARSIVINELNDETYIFYDLLKLSVATFPILRKVLDKSPPHTINRVKRGIEKDPKENRVLHTENIFKTVINEANRKAVF